MPFISDPIDYYKAITGESDLTADTWYINTSKRHAFAVYSDETGIQDEKFIVQPVDVQNIQVNIFSDKSGLVFYRTKTETDELGGEDVVLYLDNRVITLIVDQSGSMTWNDNQGLRFDVAEQLVRQIAATYPGQIYYNLIEYGSAPIKLVFFATKDTAQVAATNANDLISDYFVNHESGYSGTCIVRNETGYPTSPLDGDLVYDGFMNKFFDSGLVSGRTYYYTLYTMNKYGHFSTGQHINITPRSRIIPRGVAIFGGKNLIGSGVPRDEYTKCLWHFDEGGGSKVYDFGSLKTDLTTAGTVAWMDSDYVPSGKSAMRFYGGGNTAASGVVSEDWNWQKFTFMAWVYPYDLSNPQFILHLGPTNSYDDGGFGIYFDAGGVFCYGGGMGEVPFTTNAPNLYEWNHIAVTIDMATKQITFYVNGVPDYFTYTETLTLARVSKGDKVFIGGDDNAQPLTGKMTEVSIHSVVRDSTYIAKYANSNIDPDTYEIINEDTDNGDRLNVMNYMVDADYDFVGGSVKVLRNDYNYPSWDGDEKSTVVYVNSSPLPGEYYFTDSSNLVLGETIYYRIYSKNSMGNVSLDTDSKVLSATIPPITNGNLPTFVDSYQYAPSNVSVMVGNEKLYFTWTNYIANESLSRIKVYVLKGTRSPVVNADGHCEGELVYNGPLTSTGFVHRQLTNGDTYSYTIFNVDRFGRTSSTYYASASSTPSSLADDVGIPLPDIENISYELVSDTSLSISWDDVVTTTDDVTGWLDQEVMLYAAMTDIFGRPVPKETLIDLYIKAEIERNSFADENVFGGAAVTTVTDDQFYKFVVAKSGDGIIKGSIKMTRDADLLGRVKTAKFTVKVKAVIPFASGGSTTAAEDILSDLINRGVITRPEDVIITTDEGSYLFEFTSQPIVITLSNPFSVDLINRDNKYVSSKCLQVKPPEEEGYMPEIEDKGQSYNGVYAGASVPFVARAVLSYAGGTLANSSTVDVRIWDVWSSDWGAGPMNLCSTEGSPVAESQTVTLPNSVFQVRDGLDALGRPISYVDIPIYAPANVMPVKLYIRARYLGYYSVQSMYIVFQSTLRINVIAASPVKSDGVSIAEQQAVAYIVDPDFPDDASKFTMPADRSIVKWDLENISAQGNFPFYSLDKVPVASGVYSYTRRGTARNVFFGPCSQVAKKGFLVVTASITHQGMTDEAKGLILVQATIEITEDTMGDKFLMELPSMNQDLVCDGVHYTKLIISKDPNTSTTTYADCFRDCLPTYGRTVYELNLNQIVKLSGGASTEFVWGEGVEEIIDPYTDESYLITTDDSEIAKGTAYVAVSGDYTPVYIRVNSNTPDIEGEPPVDDSEDPLVCGTENERVVNPCMCLLPSDGITNCNSWMFLGDISVTGETFVYVDGKAKMLAGGGSPETGVPPCQITLVEPLRIRLVQKKINGEIVDFATAADIALLGLKKSKGVHNPIIVSGNAVVELTVQVSFAGKNVPAGTPIYAVIGNNNGTSPITADHNICPIENEIRKDIDDFNTRSYATFKFYPRVSLSSDYIEYIRILSTYDEMDEVERVQSVPITVTVMKPVQGSSGSSFSWSSMPPKDSVFKGALKRLDMTTDIWEDMASMPVARGNFCFEQSDGYFFAIGGITESETDYGRSCCQNNDRYDPITDTWTVAAHMPTARYGAVSAVDSTTGKIYVAGGIKMDDTTGYPVVSTDLEVYDPRDNSWQKLSPMPTVIDGVITTDYGVAEGVAQCVSGKVYILTGINSIRSTRSLTNYTIGSYNNRVEIYDIITNTWSTVLLASGSFRLAKRYFASSFVRGDRIVVVNGVSRKSDGTLDYKEEIFGFDVVSGTIVDMEGDIDTLPIEKYMAAVASNGDDHYLLGGTKSTGLSNYVEIITAPTISTKMSYTLATSKRLYNGVTGASALYYTGDPDYGVSDHIYLCGGYTSGRGW